MNRTTVLVLCSVLTMLIAVGCAPKETGQSGDDGLVATAPLETGKEAAAGDAESAASGESSPTLQANYESGLSLLEETKEGPREDLAAWRASIDKAIDAFTNCIAEAPDFSEGYRGRGEALLRRGLAFIGEEGEVKDDAETDLQNAAADFEMAVAMDEENVAAYIGRGKALQAVGDYDAALSDFARALKIDPNSAAAQTAKAACLAEQAQSGKAE